MAEENGAVGEETITRFVLEAPGGGTIQESSTLRMVLEGDSRIIEAAADVVLYFLQVGFSGEIVEATDAEGNDIMPRREVIDPLSTGEDPVEE